MFTCRQTLLSVKQIMNKYSHSQSIQNITLQLYCLSKRIFFFVFEHFPRPCVIACSAHVVCVYMCVGLFECLRQKSHYQFYVSYVERANEPEWENSVCVCVSSLILLLLACDCVLLLFSHSCLFCFLFYLSIRLFVAKKNVFNMLSMACIPTTSTEHKLQYKQTPLVAIVWQRADVENKIKWNSLRAASNDDFSTEQRNKSSSSARIRRVFNSHFQYSVERSRGKFSLWH